MTDELNNTATASGLSAAAGSITDAQLSRFMGLMKMQGHFSDMDNRELLWNLKRFVETLDLDLDSPADWMFGVIEDRLYPEYDGENVIYEDWGWSTPEGEIRYIQSNSEH